MADLSQAFEDEQRKTADLQQLVQVSIAMKGAEDTDDGDNDKVPYRTKFRRTKLPKI